MPATKIQDEAEVRRWFEEGRTYQWMIEEYRRKYNIETVPSMWGNFRRRRGLVRRINRDDDMIPWEVKPEHRWNYHVTMLRAAARREAGLSNNAQAEARLDSWLATLSSGDRVVDYDPDSPDGFSLVPRREGVDTGLIREPVRKTTKRPAADHYHPVRTV